MLSLKETMLAVVEVYSVYRKTQSIEKLYSTDFTAEKLLLAIREVPTEKTASRGTYKFFPNPGTTAQALRPSKNSHFAIKEDLSIASHRRACAFLRLSDGQQLAISSLKM